MQDLASRDLASYYDRKVPPDARKAGQRSGLWRPVPAARKALEQHLSDDGPAGEAELVQHLRMDFTHNPDRLPLAEDLPRAAWVEAGIFAWIRAGEVGLFEIRRRDDESVSHRGERRLDGAQFGRRGTGAPGGNVRGQCQHLQLVDRVGCRFPEHGAELEETRAALVLTCVDC